MFPEVWRPVWGLLKKSKQNFKGGNRVVLIWNGIDRAQCPEIINFCFNNGILFQWENLGDIK